MLSSLRGLTRKMTEHVLSEAISACGVSSTGSWNSGLVTDLGYEDAVKALHGLQSNAEAIAKARQNPDKKKNNAIPKMNKFILRSGLTEEDVDKLSVIHVSGTKGKGSSCAFCERILAHHGYKTGLFSSPHLIHVRERIRINGRPISAQMFSKYFWKVYSNLQQTQNEADLSAEEGGGMPAYFAFLTVLSLHVFLGEGVDVAVMEVGIGGQYDSTNFFRKPEVCGVTSLGLDHTNLLGNTIEEIAWNKAGIFKPGRPAITVPQERSAMDVILNRAIEIKNPLYVALPLPREVIEKYQIHLGIAGSKQVENASLAIQLYRMWKKVHGQDLEMAPTTSAMTVDEIPALEVNEVDQSTVQGLSTCVWPGRAQTLRRGAITYYLDGAHTKESIETCAEWFKQAADDEVKTRGGKIVRILVFNTTGDRDVGPFLTCLKACNFDGAVFCTNLLSTVESVNLPDQLNRTVTPRWMMEKLESNKASWDSLQASHEETLDLSDQRSDSLISSTADDLGTDVDLNSNETCPEDQKRIVGMNGEIGVDDHRTAKRLKTQYNAMVSSSGQSAGQARQICSLSSSSSSSSSSENSSSTQGKNNSASPILNELKDEKRIKHTQNIVTTGTASGSQSAHPTVNSHTTITHPISNSNGSVVHPVVDTSDFLAPHSDSGSVELKSSPSLAFPCILQALAWATQGRDPLVEVKEPDCSLPPIPERLKDAEHIQILITGSLHLVGGVLGVVDPFMND